MGYDKYATTYYPSAPVIQALSRDRWMTIADHVNLRTGRRIRKGFIFDGASIPRFLWRVAGHPMQGDLLPAALEHDAEYAAHLISKENADLRFLRNMEWSGIGYFRRHLIYWAVRHFGATAWASHSLTAARAQIHVVDENSEEKPCAAKKQNGKGSRVNVRNSSRKWRKRR